MFCPIGGIMPNSMVWQATIIEYLLLNAKVNTLAVYYGKWNMNISRKTVIYVIYLL